MLSIVQLRSRILIHITSLVERRWKLRWVDVAGLRLRDDLLRRLVVTNSPEVSFKPLVFFLDVELHLLHAVILLVAFAFVRDFVRVVEVWGPVLLVGLLTEPSIPCRQVLAADAWPSLLCLATNLAVEV